MLVATKQDFQIRLEINNSGYRIVGLRDDLLHIVADIDKIKNDNVEKIQLFKKEEFDIAKITKPINAHQIYNTLKENYKNKYKDKEIIEKIEKETHIEYHFNFGLSVNVIFSKGLSAVPSSLYFSFTIIGNTAHISEKDSGYFRDNYGYEGKPYKSVFHKEVYMSNSCFERIYFSNCEFKSKVSLHFIKESNEKIEFHNGVDFSNCVFGDEVDFRYFVSGTGLPENKYYNNAQDTNFSNCYFNKNITFHKSKIFNNIDFTHTTFNDYADFSQCEFEKTANLYGAKFEKAPNFSQVQFKGSLNAVNMDLDFGFTNLKEIISGEFKKYNNIAPQKQGCFQKIKQRISAKLKKEQANDKKLTITKPLTHFANDFRDSFRIFKNALIKENNNLDASEFHKLELYCKEIELGESPNKRGIQAQSEEDVRKNTKPFKESIDWFLLRFYRKLSEHHTDLLRVLNNLILLIALYAGFIYISNFKIDDTKTSSISQQLSQNIECLKDSIRESSFIQEYNLSLQLVLIILSILFVAFAIYLVFKLKLLIHIKTTFKIILAGIMKDFWLLLKILSVILSIFCIITFIVLQFETNNRSSILVNIFGFCLFIILYLWLVCLDSIFLRYIVVIVAYIVASVTLGKNIAILSPFLGKLMSDDKSPTDSFFVAITLAYTILTLLVLFSLQKTARKNSIVPS